MGVSKKSGDEGVNRRKDVQAVTLRLPAEIYEAMRVFAFATENSINEVGAKAIQNYLAGEGRETQVQAFLDKASEQYRVALDKLADT